MAPDSDRLAGLKIRLALFLIRLLGLLPLKLLSTLAVPAGWLAWRLPLKQHAVIATNLALAFPELDDTACEQLHREHLVEMMRLVLETGAVWHWSAEAIGRHMRRIDGWEHIEQARQGGRGVILVSAHLGNWEIANLYLGAHLPLTSLYRAPRDPAADRAVIASRQRLGGELVASGSPAMRRLLQRLRQGGAVALMADQQPKQGEGVFTPLFGTPALTMTLVNRLARRTACPVLFVAPYRLSGGRGWSLDIRPAPDAINDADPVRANRVFHAWLEAAIRRHPAQYLWSYKRFSIRPAGEAPIYPPRRS